MTYRLMQYNVTHQKQGWTWMKELFDIAKLPFSTRMQNVVNVIKTIAPDILCLAERHDEWAGIKHDSNPLVDMAVTLTDYLPSNYAIAQDYVTYEGNTVVNRVPILYNTNKFRCVESGFLVLTEEWSFAASENKRIVTWAILEDVTDTENKGKQIAVFNTHWTIKSYDNGVTVSDYTEIRKAQSQEMQNLINSAKFTNMARVACGDFNALYGEQILTDLFANCNLTHADVAMNGKLTFNGVDHVGYTDDVVPQSFFVYRDAVNAADHFPVYFDFFIN